MWFLPLHLIYFRQSQLSVIVSESQFSSTGPVCAALFCPLLDIHAYWAELSTLSDSLSHQSFNWILLFFDHIHNTFNIVPQPWSPPTNLQPCVVPESTKITLAPSNADVKVGENAWMQCAASHDPALDITFIWSLDGQVIDLHVDSQHYERTPVRYHVNDFKETWRWMHLALMLPTPPHLQNLSYSLDLVHTEICLRLGFQAGRVIFEVGSFCNIFVGIPEMEKYSLLWMNMTLKAISHSFPEWNSALCCICLRAIWPNINYCWRDVHSLFLYCSSNHKLVVSISHLSLCLPGKHQIMILIDYTLFFSLRQGGFSPHKKSGPVLLNTVFCGISKSTLSPKQWL